MYLNTSEISSVIKSQSFVRHSEITGVSTDTRSIKPGMLFVALRGERYDGHNYIEQALRNGAVAVVVDNLSAVFKDRSLLVQDTLIAYGQIASAWRQKFQLPVVAVTGSVGKTTLKEMAALTLSPLGLVLRSEKNENNEVGVPQTLLRLSSEHAAAVIEMGMRGFDQIKYLAAIARPTVGAITVIGESHIELVGSRDGIADAKGELVESLSTSDYAVLNADDPYFTYLAAKTLATIVSYGVAENATVRVENAVQDGTSWNFDIRNSDTVVQVHIESPAWHDVVNAAGALAVAVSVGVNLQQAAETLQYYRPVAMRMELITALNGATVISDCYNAAPSSVISALRTLSSFPNQGAKLAFLGDMRELGQYAKQLHSDVANAAAKSEITNIYAIGDFMPEAFPGARAFKTSGDAAEYVRSGFVLEPNDVVLVKGSRALEMEKIVEALITL